MNLDSPATRNARPGGAGLKGKGPLVAPGPRPRARRRRALPMALAALALPITVHGKDVVPQYAQGPDGAWTLVETWSLLGRECCTVMADAVTSSRWYNTLAASTSQTRGTTYTHTLTTAAAAAATPTSGFVGVSTSGIHAVQTTATRSAQASAATHSSLRYMLADSDDLDVPAGWKTTPRVTHFYYVPVIAALSVILAFLVIGSFVGVLIWRKRRRRAARQAKKLEDVEYLCEKRAPPRRPGRRPGAFMRVGRLKSYVRIMRHRSGAPISPANSRSRPGSLISRETTRGSADARASVTSLASTRSSETATPRATAISRGETTTHLAARPSHARHSTDVLTGADGGEVSEGRGGWRPGGEDGSTSPLASDNAPYSPTTANRTLPPGHRRPYHYDTGDDEAQPRPRSEADNTPAQYPHARSHTAHLTTDDLLLVPETSAQAPPAYLNNGNRLPHYSAGSSSHAGHAPPVDLQSHWPGEKDETEVSDLAAATSTELYLPVDSYSGADAIITTAHLAVDDKRVLEAIRSNVHTSAEVDISHLHPSAPVDEPEADDDLPPHAYSDVSSPVSTLRSPLPPPSQPTTYAILNGPTSWIENLASAPPDEDEEDAPFDDVEQ